MYKELNNKITQTSIKDPHLTDYGILSAKLIGEQFFEKKIKINKFYVSPLIRTWETAYSFLKKDIGFPTDLKLTIAPDFLLVLHCGIIFIPNPSTMAIINLTIFAAFHCIFRK